uniref:Biphenyl 2,3-dioxygenase n=4 Tax=Nostocales TaxID=1161 RepID=A0A0C1RN23_9CYAN
MTHNIYKKNYKIMRVILAIALLCLLIATTASVEAADFQNILKQPVIETTISLGTSTNELQFEPNHLEFEAGKRYKLRLINPSTQKHYFTAKDFADSIWTQKVEAGNVEIKGAIHELELKPKAEAEWFFVPLKLGTYSLRCPITGHTEAGMTGEIIISAER